MSIHQPKEINEIKPLHDWILVTEMNFEERTLSSGIVLLRDNGKSSGIRPRWGRVYAIGPEQTSVSVGDYICVAHGRWTRGIEIKDAEGVKTIRRIDPNDILLVNNEMPEDDTISDAVMA
jgi:co-chaperonin GroES (HSP10)